jgi:hypothetical protein
MIKNQLDEVDDKYKLKESDISRICKYIDTSIFDKEKCCIWQGSVANINNDNKGTYVNFYFNKNKVILHRLLYINYINDLHENEYIKFKCENKGLCCNVNHYKKYKKKGINPKDTDDTEEKNIVIMKIGNLIIDFDS